MPELYNNKPIRGIIEKAFIKYLKDDLPTRYKKDKTHYDRLNTFIEDCQDIFEFYILHRELDNSLKLYRINHFDFIMMYHRIVTLYIVAA